MSYAPILPIVRLHLKKKGKKEKRKKGVGGGEDCTWLAVPLQISTVQYSSS